MKILIIHQYFLEKGAGGGSRFNQFAKYWADAGHEITVIAGTVDYASGEKLKKYKRKYIIREKVDKNISVLRCHVAEIYNKNFLGRLWASFPRSGKQGSTSFIKRVGSYLSFVFSATWAGLFCAGKHDIIITTSPPLFVAIPGYLISRLKRIPLIFEVRDLWPKFAIDTGVLTNSLIIKLSYWLESFIYKKAKLINVLTPAFKEYLIKEKNVLKDKIIYIPNAADLDLMQPGEHDNLVHRKFGWQDKFVILYIGAHGVANDLQQIIEAAKLLKQNQDIIFALVGDGMEKPKLQLAVKKAGLKNIQFIDSVPKEKVVDFINASDACTAILQPVFTTTYPNKVFDYMACAKPIILPIDGACRELVLNQAHAGIFIEPNNSKAFKEAILYLKNNSAQASELGESGYKFVTQNFDREKLAKKYLRIINENLFSQ